MQRNSLIMNCPHVVFDFRKEFHESSRFYFWSFTYVCSVVTKMKRWFLWLQLFFFSKYFFHLHPKNWMLNLIEHDDFRFFFRYPIRLFGEKT
jgi:hypothetical protein